MFRQCGIFRFITTDTHWRIKKRRYQNTN